MKLKTGFDNSLYPCLQYWISPSGDVYQCDYHCYQGHNRVACFILTGKDLLHDESVCAGLTIKQRDRLVYDGEFTDSLLKLGWVRITRGENRDILIDSAGFISDAQRSELAEFQNIVRTKCFNNYKIIGIEE